MVLNRAKVRHFLSLLATLAVATVPSVMMAQEFVPGEVIINLKGSGKTMKAQAFIGKAVSEKAMTLKGSYSGLNMHHFKLGSGQDLEATLRDLRNDPDVEYAEPNYILKAPGQVGQEEVMSMSDVRTQAAVAASSTVRILIVDDNESNRTILHHLVSGWGMRVGQACNAAEAMDMLEQAAAKGEPYDAAVLDMLMPGKEGLQLAQDIRAHQNGAGVRLVVLTSLIEPGHAERARRAGFTAYLTKPVRHDQLQGCLRVVFGLHHQVPAAAIGTSKGRPISPTLITRHTLAEQCSRPRILVAEDNVVNQKLAVRMLDRLGYQPDVVSNGQEAVTRTRIPEHWWSYYFFSQNLVLPQDKFFAEAWSLSVEEWFYVLLPIAFLICMRVRRDRGSAGMWPVLVLFLVVPFVLRAWKLHTGIDIAHIDSHARRMICMRLDNIIVGVTAAWLACVRPAWWRLNRRWMAACGVALLITFKLQLFLWGDSPMRALMFEHNVGAIGCTLLLPLLSGWNPVKPRWLIAPVQQLARLSYAMYLLNLTVVMFSIMPLLPPLLNGAEQETWRMSLLPLAVHWGLTLALAFVLYHGFEKHMTAMRERTGLRSA